MEIISGIALIFLFIISSALLILVPSCLRQYSSRNRRRPPGPWAFLFVGSIHHMLTSQPQAALRDLAEKHGPVMYLRLGQIDTVVISSPAAAREVLQAKDVSFASRPTLVATEIIGYGSLDLAFAPYGDYWRALRKLCVAQLFSARKVREFAAVRDRETMSLVAEIRAAAAGRGGANVGRLLVSCTNAITRLATFGDGCSRECNAQFLSALAMVQRDSSGFCVSDLFPSLWFVDVLTGLRRRLRREHRQLDEMFNKIIDECDARWKQQETVATNVTRSGGGGEEDDAAAGSGSGSGSGSGEDNLLRIMLRVRDKEELSFPFNNDNIKAILVDLFLAGTETISTAAEWVMSELMRHPAEMARAQAEVREAFNNKITPRHHESHMDRLNYTRMVIKETLRLHPSVPLLLPRLCRDTCDIGGFEVTKGSRVLINAWAMARSPEYWGDDAEDFRPARFENKMAADYNGTDFSYLPFGSGRRMCPGTGFGLATLELIVARLLYYFDWSLPGNMLPEELDMETVVDATAKRRNQLHLVATPHI